MGLASPVFFVRIGVEHKQGKSESAGPNLHPGTVKGQDFVHHLKIQMPLGQWNCTTEAQAQRTALDRVRSGNDAVVADVWMQVQHAVSKEFESKISAELIVRILVNQVLKTHIGMPKSSNMGVALQSGSYPVANGQTLVFDLTRLQSHGQKIGLAHLGMACIRQPPCQKEDS